MKDTSDAVTGKLVSTQEGGKGVDNDGDFVMTSGTIEAQDRGVYNETDNKNKYS